MAIRVRLGHAAQVDAAVSIYERSNLARRQGVWPNRAARVEGIGGVILDAVLAEAKRRDCSRIHLWTDHDHERSNLLYRSRGFSPTGETAAGEGEWARTI